jgi:predicted NAD/FAD-binding protein
MSGSDADFACESLDRYLRRIRLPAYFVQNYFLPLISSVTTCSHQALLKFPARDVVEYKKRTHKAPHYVVAAGVHEVQEKLAQGLKVTLGSRVTSVEYWGSKVRVSWTKTTGNLHDSTNQQRKLFDHVIMAVSPDVAGLIFEPLRKDMAHVPTIYVESIIHTDTSMLFTQPTSNKPTSQPSRSNESQMIHLRSSLDSTESIHEQPSSVVVTTCPTSPIDPLKIIRRSGFTRVLRTPRSREIVNRVFGSGRSRNETFSKSLQWRNGDGNVWLVGGWCWDGMVLLEGCVVSAMRMADGMGVHVPWRKA